MVENLIVARLTATAITAVVGSRIYPTDPVEGSALPYIVYTIGQGKPEYSLSGPTGNETYQVEIYGETTSLAQQTTLGNAIRTQLHGYRGGNIQGSFLADEHSQPVEDEEGTYYTLTQSYTVHANPVNTAASPDTTGLVFTGHNSVSLTACEHTLTLDCDGLNLDGQPVGGGNPAGGDTEIQFNEGGSFGADSKLKYDYTNEQFRITSDDGYQLFQTDGNANNVQVGAANHDTSLTVVSNPGQTVITLASDGTISASGTITAGSGAGGINDTGNVFGTSANLGAMSVDGSGNVHAAAVFATSFDGDGSALTALNATQITTGSLATARGGVPTGGTAGQGLLKNSSTNYDASWGQVIRSITPPSGMSAAGTNPFLFGGQLAISAGGTGQSTAANARNALMPTQTGNSGHFLTTDGSAMSWNSAALAVAQGGTGQTTTTAAINALLPSQATFSGHFLTTNSSTLSWNSSPLAILQGGTGASTNTAAFDNLAPSQIGNSGKFLTTNGTTTSWGTSSGNLDVNSPQSASFTWINQSSAGVSDVVDGMYIHAPANPSFNNVSQLIQAVPGSTWTLTVGYVPLCGYGGYGLVGPTLYDNGTGHFLFNRWGGQENSGADSYDLIQRFTDGATDAGSPLISISGTASHRGKDGAYWVRVINDGTYLYFYWGANRECFLLLSQNSLSSLSSFIAPTHCGFAVNPYSTEAGALITYWSII